MGKTLFDKIWDAHVVNDIEGGPSQLYIDRHYCHEVTSPQAFEGLRKRGLKVFRPEKTYCSPDHNIPTLNQDRPIADPVSRNQVETLTRNAQEFGVTLYGLGHPKNGIIHVIGPENGLTLPGYTIVCGDSHTSTHGAFGAVAFGIGTSEVEMVLASQCILQPKPKTMRINVNGELRPGVTAKDIALYIITRMTTGGATGYFVEYAGDTIRRLSMEERMTVCNLSIEMGARGGMIAPDETTIAYVKGREFAPEARNGKKPWPTGAPSPPTTTPSLTARSTSTPPTSSRASPSAPTPEWASASTIRSPRPIPKTKPERSPTANRSTTWASKWARCLPEPRGLRIPRQLHQRPHRRLPSLCQLCQRAPQSSGHHRLARARIMESRHADPRGGARQNS